MQNSLLEYLVARVEKIDDKVDELLRFKWQVLGGGLVLTSVQTFIIQLLFIYYKELS